MEMVLRKIAQKEKLFLKTKTQKKKQILNLMQKSSAQFFVRQ